jgi:hypothetical protein
LLLHLLNLDKFRELTEEECRESLACYDFLRTVTDKSNVMYSHNYPIASRKILACGHFLSVVHKERLELMNVFTEHLLEEVAPKMEARRRRVTLIKKSGNC